MGEVEAEGEAAISAMTSSRDAVWISAAWRLLSVLSCESSTLTEMREAVVRGKLRETGKMRRGRRKLNALLASQLVHTRKEKKGAKFPSPNWQRVRKRNTHSLQLGMASAALFSSLLFSCQPGQTVDQRTTRDLKGAFPQLFPIQDSRGNMYSTLDMYIMYVQLTYIRTSYISGMYIRITNPRLRCKIQGLINAPRPVICCSQFSR